MHKFEFCIPSVGNVVPAGADWFHEIKYDGYRLRVERDGERVHLITRVVMTGLRGSRGSPRRRSGTAASSSSSMALGALAESC
jgi:hypothetical protein